MASPAVSTPIRTHHGLFSSKTAGGRMPLTPSPRNRNTSLASNISKDDSPFTPPRASCNASRSSSQSIYPGNLASHFAKSVSKPASRVVSKGSSYRESPKSIIPRVTPRHLEPAVSEWTLTGTGPAAGQTPSTKRSKKDITLRSRTAKTTVRLPHKTADRFIPNRSTSEGLITAGSAKSEDTKRPKTSGGDGSSVLANAASVFDLSGHSNGDDLADAFEGLGLEDNTSSSNTSSNTTSYSRPDPEAEAYKSSLASACGLKLNTRILEFKPAAPESSKPIDLRSQYNRPLRSATSQSAQFRRRIQTAPDRVLDAPGLVDDYYLNLLDWSSGNQVAIGLERNVYVWSAESGGVSCLMETAADTYVSSVKWSGDGAYVGVGLGSGEVQIWDVEEGTKLRSMYGHETRVGVMGWSKHTLSTGARSGLVFNHDVRIAQHKTAELVSHTSEVCGLEWRSDGAQLATGGNDNLVSIWDARSLAAPKFAKTNHRAAVKALSWCPWQLNLLATGGGSYDKHIHFWNTTTGARTNSIDTGSQVTSLRWSNHYRELVSSSGFPDNSLSIWSYPSLVRNVEIPAHETRVLHSCLSPDGQMLATAAADESLKFWKIFERKPGSASSASREGGITGKSSKMAKQMTIR
ncbi:ubiquitin-protein transferase activating protein [Myotisia sp. PD_48]|nr:ubiquitin-protein transferase activating protein [Myotisia sp. PD_48]